MRSVRSRSSSLRQQTSQPWFTISSSATLLATCRHHAFIQSNSIQTGPDLALASCAPLVSFCGILRAADSGIHHAMRLAPRCSNKLMYNPQVRLTGCNAELPYWSVEMLLASYVLQCFGSRTSNASVKVSWKSKACSSAPMPSRIDPISTSPAWRCPTYACAGTARLLVGPAIK